MTKDLSKTLQTLLIKPAGPTCNMACRYCFYRHKAAMFKDANSNAMSIETLDNLIQQAMQQSKDSIAFVWQGGEPTLLGVPFFQQVVALQQKYGTNQKVGNALQTNGLLIDNDWIAFLKQYNFLVGISIDGPKEIHDHHRMDQQGGPTFDRVKNKAQLLLKNSVATNSLTVINDVTSQHPDEIYACLKDIGFTHMQFVPYIGNQKIDSPFAPNPNSFATFLCRLFDLWIADFQNGQPTTSVRYFESLFYRYVGMQAPDCTLHKTCGPYLLVERNGDIFPCDFYVTPEWKLGNIHQNQLTEVLNSKQHLDFGKQKAALSNQCRKCLWFTYCYGGCVAERTEISGGQTRYCEGFKAFFAHADKRFSKLADQWKARQTHSQGAIKTGRNALCPCGSGKKYKRCCGSSSVKD